MSLQGGSSKGFCSTTMSQCKKISHQDMELLMSAQIEAGMDEVLDETVADNWGTRNNSWGEVSSNLGSGTNNYGPRAGNWDQSGTNNYGPRGSNWNQGSNRGQSGPGNGTGVCIICTVR